MTSVFPRSAAAASLADARERAGLLPLLLALCLIVPPAASGQSATTDTGTLDAERADALHGKRPYSPYADRSYPTRPLFGDTHMHTSFSMDAGAFGARLTPRDAYRIARGDLHEKVYDVAWGGGRRPDANGKLPAVGNTVDVPNATSSASSRCPAPA